MTSRGSLTVAAPVIRSGPIVVTSPTTTDDTRMMEISSMLAGYQAVRVPGLVIYVHKAWNTSSAGETMGSARDVDVVCKIGR